jgi:hypothetical protein
MFSLESLRTELSSADFRNAGKGFIFTHPCRSI